MPENVVKKAQNGKNIRIWMPKGMLEELRDGMKAEQERQPGQLVTLSGYVRQCAIERKRQKDLEAEEGQ